MQKSFFLPYLKCNKVNELSEAIDKIKKYGYNSRSSLFQNAKQRNIDVDVIGYTVDSFRQTCDGGDSYKIELSYSLTDIVALEIDLSILEDKMTDQQFKKYKSICFDPSSSNSRSPKIEYMAAILFYTIKNHKKCNTQNQI